MAKAIVSLVPFSKWVSYWPYVFRWVFWGNQHTKLLEMKSGLPNDQTGQDLGQVTIVHIIETTREFCYQNCSDLQ